MRTRLILPLLLALPLAAQTSPFTVTLGAIQGFDSLKKATHGTGGFLAGGDYATQVWGTDVPARVGLTLGTLPGKEYNGLKTSLTLVQLHGDLAIPTASPVTVLVGLSANHYTMAKTGVENTEDPLDMEHHFPVRDVRGLKLGLRAGAGYRFTPHWGAEVLFQMTELAGKDLEDPMVRAGGVNPGWLELDLRYRF